MAAGFSIIESLKTNIKPQEIKHSHEWKIPSRDCQYYWEVTGTDPA